MGSNSGVENKNFVRNLALDELRVVLLSAGVSFPKISPSRWEAAYHSSPLPSLEELGLDSLGMNELSISLELVSGIELTTADLFLLKSLDDILLLIMQKKEKVEPATVTSAIFSTKRKIGGSFSTLRTFLMDIAGSWTHQELLLINLLPLRLFPFAGEIVQVGKQISQWGGSSVSWSRRKIATDTFIYRATPNLAGSIPVVVFGGALRRPNMPTVYFLRGVENFTDTVVLVRSRRHDAFRSGIRGVGSDLPESFKNLAVMLKRLLEIDGKIQRPLLLGTSGGGLPALIFSTYIEARSVVLIGPNSTRDPRWADSQSLSYALERRRLVESAPVTIAYGEESNDGGKIPEWQQDIANCSTHSISNAGHAALYQLFMSGGLEDFLIRAVDDNEKSD